MRIINQLFGQIVYGIAKSLSFAMDGSISVIETAVLMAKSFIKGCALLISMGGCLFFLLMIGPLGAFLLRNPLALLVAIFIMIFPVVGAISIAYLKYIKYISTEYLFNLADYLKGREKARYHSLGYFKKAYRRAEEERIRREQQRRYEQQREWEERFRQWHYQNAQWGQGSYQRSYQGAHGSQGYGQTSSNPYVEFKNKYKKSCDILGVPEDADQYRIKLAYRKKAKELHPDVNRDPNATRKFQEINDAYEFLNEDNIQRYKRMQ